MPRYSVATQWDTDAMVDMIHMFNDQHKLNDIYGSLSHSIIGHGRSSNAVPNIDFASAKKHISAIQKEGITFNYLFNGAFDSQKLHDPIFYNSTVEYLKRVIEELEIRYVTIAVPELIELVNSLYPHVFIKVSTIFNILSVRDLKKLDGKKFNRVAMGNDAPRNPKRIQEMLKYCQGRNFDLEIMITETCIYQCKTRSAHYKSFNEKSNNGADLFMNNCILNRILHPEEFFKSCWIRPEDLKYYSDLGIDNFKISGRSKSPEWTKNCLLSYINGGYDGNIMEIFGTTPPNFSSSKYLFYIDNKSLQPFMDHHPMNCYDNNCHECGYCEETAINLIKSGKFMLNKDCGEYKIVNGHIVCEPGNYTQNLMRAADCIECLN